MSTDSEEQLNSFGNQIEEWTKRILENPQYQLVKVYNDEGISGTSDKGREGFKQMIKDAKEGKIDLILCKSISRFARNTLLSIQTVRELKEIGVEVYFDAEKISSFDPNNELVFTLLCTIAQEESKHISDNVKWTFQKMMNEGKPFLDTTHFLGYDLSEDKTHLVINPEQAVIVKLIYDMYDAGAGPSEIRRELVARGYKTLYGSDRWCCSTLTSILRNEKYCGDLMLQKTYTVDYLSHKRKDNKGQRRKYYVQDAHEAIIPRDQWERVQRRLDRQKEKAIGANRDLNKYNTKYPLSGMLICYQCGKSYKRRHWTSGYKSKEGKFVYQCESYVNPEEHGFQERCGSKAIGEVLLLKMCAEVINKIYLSNSNIFEKLKELIKASLSTESVDEQIAEKNKKKELLSQQIDEVFQQKLKFDNFEIREKLEKQYAQLVEEYQSVLTEIRLLNDRTSSNNDLIARIDEMMTILNHREITAEMINKEILDAFMYRIIVIDSNSVVVTINVTNTMPLEELRNQRKEVCQRAGILENVIIAKDPVKRKKLHYKVVLV